MDGFLRSLGVTDPVELALTALTHRSYSAESIGTPHNERLEFLGDTILGQSVTLYLFRTFPELSEGDLAKRRSSLVSTTALAVVARQIGLGRFLRLGRGERITGGADKDSILADAVEALIGAVFLGAGPTVADAFVLRLLSPLFADPDRFTVLADPKTALQECAAANGMSAPKYTTVGAGPDHNRVFTATVHVGESLYATGEAPSKKQAELAAARVALAVLRQQGVAGA